MRAALISCMMSAAVISGMIVPFGIQHRGRSECRRTNVLPSHLVRRTAEFAYPKWILRDLAAIAAARGTQRFDLGAVNFLSEEFEKVH